MKVYALRIATEDNYVGLNDVLDNVGSIHATLESAKREGNTQAKYENEDEAELEWEGSHGTWDVERNGCYYRIHEMPVLE